MKTKWILRIGALVCAIVTAFISGQNNDRTLSLLENDVEALSWWGENSTVIVCYCVWDTYQGGKPTEWWCACNGYGIKCAESEPGKNIDCSKVSTYMCEKAISLN